MAGYWTETSKPTMSAPTSAVNEITTFPGIENIQDIQREDKNIPTDTIIQTVVVITICGIGLGANSCALLVLLKSSIIKSSTGIYLAFLAVYDNLFLVAHLIYSYSYLFRLSQLTCKLFSAAMVSITTISCYILVIMTVEKCYVLTNPYKTKPTQKQALTVATVSVITITLLLAIPTGITHGLTPLSVDQTFSNSPFSDVADNNNFPTTVNEKIVCGVLPQYENFSEKVFFPILVLLTRLLAPLIVIICNLKIIIYLRKHAIQVAPLNATSNPNNDKRITKLLMTVSLCFVLLITPSGIYVILIPYFYDDITEALDPDNPAYQAVVDCLLINHSINYFLYIIASKTFRKEAKAVFKSRLSIFVRNTQH